MKYGIIFDVEGGYEAHGEWCPQTHRVFQGEFDQEEALSKFKELKGLKKNPQLIHYQGVQVVEKLEVVYDDPTRNIGPQSI